MRMIPNNKDRDRDSALDVQVGGDHYKNFPIQPIVFTHLNKFNDIQSAVIWYMCRYNLKGQALQDLKKAQHFIDILIELEDLDDTPKAIGKHADIDWAGSLHAKLYGVEPEGQSPFNYQRGTNDD